jgi:hypothetical protein
MLTDAVDKVVRQGRVGGADFDEYAEEVYHAAEPTLGRALDNFAVYREAMEADFRATSENVIRELDMSVALAAYVARSLSRSPSPPADAYQSAYVLLLTRTAQVGHEINVLVRAGMPRGALARWRTLFELAVTAQVLEVGNRHTAKRWIRHGDVLTLRDARRKREPEENEVSKLKKSEQPALEKRVESWVRTYGESFQGDYDWAAELTARRLGRRAPKFNDLLDLVEVEHLLEHYRGAHHHVHADSLGSQSLVRDGSAHGGADFSATGPIVAATIPVVHQVVDSAARVWCDASPSALNPAQALLALSQEIHFIGQRTAICEGRSDTQA